MVPQTSIVGLRSHQGSARETQSYCVAIALEGLVLERGQEIVINANNLKRIENDISDTEFGSWKSSVVTRYANLFKPPIDILPASPDDLRIMTDPLAKLPFRQPYR